MPAGPTPYTLENLLGGPGVRALYAPIDEDVPVDLADIFDQTGPDYDPVGDWENLGATTDGATYTRSFDSDEMEIQQETQAVIEAITGTGREFQVPLGEVTPEHLQLFEESPEIDNVSAAAGMAAAKKIGFGNVENLTRYRVAFVARRPKGIGADVTEPGGHVRGAFVAWVGFSCQLTADSSDVDVEKGSLVSLPVTFKAFPVEEQEAGKESGFWLVETPSTISAS